MPIMKKELITWVLCLPPGEGSISSVQGRVQCGVSVKKDEGVRWGGWCVCGALYWDRSLQGDGSATVFSLLPSQRCHYLPEIDCLPRTLPSSLLLHQKPTQYFLWLKGESPLLETTNLLPCKSLTFTTLYGAVKSLSVSLLCFFCSISGCRYFP